MQLLLLPIPSVLLLILALLLLTLLLRPCGLLTADGEPVDPLKGRRIMTRAADDKDEEAEDERDEEGEENEAE